MSIRKKLMAGIIPLAALGIFASATTVQAESETTDYGAYTVTIPAEVSIDAATKAGTLNIFSSVDAYSQLAISISSQNDYNLKSEKGNYGMKYGIEIVNSDSHLDKEIVCNTQNSTDGAREDFSRVINIKVDDNATAAVSGTYEDTLTFTMDYKSFDKAEYYKLICDPNGGTVSQKIYKKESGVAYGTLPKPTRTGYTFDGWYTGISNEEKVGETTIMGKSDTTIYAHWTANTYYIKYDANSSLHKNASGEMADSVMTYDSEQSLSKCSFKNDEGSCFVGWNTAADGSGVSYTDEQEILNLTSKANESITLYAQWNYTHIVKVRFEDVDGTMDNATREVIKKENIPAGQKISWSVANLEEYKENKTQWEKQWQTPENKETVNYITGNASETTVIDIKRQMYYLDLNSQWYDSDGTGKNGAGNLIWDGETTATVQVMINGKTDSKYNAVTDYFVRQRYGSTFSFIVTMKPGYELKGVSIGDNQPLCKVSYDEKTKTVTGIVTGERYIENTGRDPYWATTLALKIQKTASGNTTTNEEQVSDENLKNSDSEISDQNMIQSEESDAFSSENESDFLDSEFVSEGGNASIDENAVGNSDNSSECENMNTEEPSQQELEGVIEDEDRLEQSEELETIVTQKVESESDFEDVTEQGE